MVQRANWWLEGGRIEIGEWEVREGRGMEGRGRGRARDCSEGKEWEGRGRERDRGRKERVST